MYISGVDILRPTPVARARPAEAPAADAIGTAGGMGSALDRDTQDALQRFAKFVKRDPQKRPKTNGSSAAARYRAGWRHEQDLFDLGQMLDVRV